jgi:hypothetical protein
LDGEKYTMRVRQVYYGGQIKAKRNASSLLGSLELKESLERLVRRLEDNINTNLKEIDIEDFGFIKRRTFLVSK